MSYPPNWNAGCSYERENMSDDTHYEVLGSEPGASRDELRDAYRARVEDLEAARERKGVTDKQLQDNRDQVAHVRAAWNVLSDPFQRRRYDESIQGPATGSNAGDDVEILDDDDDGAPGRAVQLTGWRKLMAPPPPKNGSGKTPPARRPAPEPTISLPAGVRLAEPRARGMAMLFDLAILVVLFSGVSFLLPGLIKSDYHKIIDRISNLNDLHDSQVSIDDANSAIKSADKAIAKAQDSGKSADVKSAQSDRKSAASDLKNAESAFAKTAKDAKKNGVAAPHDAKALQKHVDNLNDGLQSTQYVTALVTLVLAMLYLVPITARTGKTFGMRNRGVRVIRVDGSPVGWYAAFTRFLIPVLLALAIPSFGPVIALGMVLWSYRDRNRQGIHDKLAKTLVVAA